MRFKIILIWFPFNPLNAFCQWQSGVINAPNSVYENKTPFSIFYVTGGITIKNNLVKHNLNLYSYKLKIDDLSAGMYFVRAEYDNNIYSSKFIKN